MNSATKVKPRSTPIGVGATFFLHSFSSLLILLAICALTRGMGAMRIYLALEGWPAQIMSGLETATLFVSMLLTAALIARKRVAETPCPRYVDRRRLISGSTSSMTVSSAMA